MSGPGKTIDVSKLSPEMKQALEQGMADAWKEFEDFKSTQVETGKVTSGDMFGTREFLKNNYLYRMAAAILGIYGNSKAEAMYPIYTVDAAGEKLDAWTHRYTLRFAPGKLPPVNAFWSVTMYELPQSLLVANPLNRYLINSPMLPEFEARRGWRRDAVHPARIAGQGQGSQLVARAEGPILDGHAPLLAEGRGDERQVDGATSQARIVRLNRSRECARRRTVAASDRRIRRNTAAHRWE